MVRANVALVLKLNDRDFSGRQTTCGAPQNVPQIILPKLTLGVEILRVLWVRLGVPERPEGDDDGVNHGGEGDEVREYGDEEQVPDCVCVAVLKLQSAFNYITCNLSICTRDEIDIRYLD